MDRAPSLAVALLGALVLAAPAAAAPAEQSNLDAATFNDAAGDGGAAPDITNVAVGNDVVAGPIVLWVTVPNRPDDLAGEDVVWVVLDTDQNPATGDEFGAEYWIGVDAESVWLERWDGAAYVEVDAPSLTGTFYKSETSVRISIHPDQLGSLRAFDFFVLGQNGDVSDAAPNGPPGWKYTLASGPLLLVTVGLVVSPKAPRAGKALTAFMAVGRNDTFDLLDEGKVTCKLTVGGKAVRAVRAGFVQGLAQCRWTLPKSAKGKPVKGTVTVTYGGGKAVGAFSRRAK